ncbi:tape measure protein [Glutamicibacter sp. X7]
MSITLASAIVHIAPSLQGATKQIQAQLSGIDMKAPGTKLGAQLSGAIGASLNLKTIGAKFSNLGGQIGGFGSKLNSGITKPALGAAAAIGGIAAATGWKRLTGIENAQAALSGLGHSAQSVEAIMKNANAAVKGTAFGLDEAASVAASAVAAGVKPGKELERTLKLTGDAATIAGVGMNEMGAIFNKVAASNKIQGDVIAQLNDAGIPIIQLLGKELGTTAEETLKLASEGKVNFETFQKAMESGLGGAALKSGETMTGSLANTRAALGRLGATALNEVFPQIKTALGDLQSAFDSPEMKQFATVIGQQLGKTFTTISNGIKGVVGWFTQLSPQMQSLVLNVAGFAVAAGPALIVIGKISTGLGAVTTAAGGMISATSKTVTALSSFRAGFMSSTAAASTFTGRMGTVGGAVRSVIGGIASGTKALVLNTGAWIKNMAIQTASVAKMAAVRVATIAATVAQRGLNLAMRANPIGIVVTAITALVAGLVWFFTQTEIGQQIWSGFVGFLKDSWANITAFFQTSLSVISTVWTTVWTSVSSFFQTIWTGISSFFTTIWNGITTAVKVGIGVVKSVITTVLNAIKNFWGNAWQWHMDLFMSIFQGIKTFGKSAMDWIKNAIQNGLNAVRSVWTNVWNSIRSFFTNIWNGIVGFAQSAIANVRTRIQAGVNAVRAVWNSVWGGISSFFSKIWQGIVSAGSKFIGSVKRTFSDALSFIRDIPNKVVGYFTGLGSKLIASGKSLISGFVDGIKQGFSNAVGAVQNGIGRIRDFFPFSPAKEGPFSGRGWVAYSGLSVGKTFSESVAGALHDGRKSIGNEMSGIQDEINGLDEPQFSVGAAVPEFASDLSTGGGSGDMSPVDRIIEALRELADRPVFAEVSVGEMSRGLRARSGRTGRANGRPDLGGPTA